MYHAVRPHGTHAVRPIIAHTDIRKENTMSAMYREPCVIKRSKDGRISTTDLTSELFNSRVLYLEGEVDDAVCNGLIRSMLVLEHQSATEPITLIINSPGGAVTAGLALIDTMQALECPVHTVGAGVVASMAAVILASGSHRRVYRHTQVLIHQLMAGTGMAQQTDIEIAAQHTAAMRAQLDDLLAERGALTAREFHELKERDCWCSAERALELGLVDEVIAPGRMP